MPHTVSVHAQSDARLRFDWGPTGAAMVGEGARYAVIVDVLSFTTTVGVAVERGAAVHPWQWHDVAGATEYADRLGATLAVGRTVARRSGGVSLSPASVRAAPPIDRLVLPSPNGSAISVALADRGAVVVAASLRNAAAVAAWVAARLGPGDAVAVIAAGERWPDGSLRPALEDHLGAGLVLAGLLDHGIGPASAEARLAAAAVRACPDVAESVTGCASGVELIEAGFDADVAIAVEVAGSAVVPILHEGAFTDGADVVDEH